MRVEFKDLQDKCSTQQKDMSEMRELIQQLKDKNALLKAQKGMQLCT